MVNISSCVNMGRFRFVSPHRRVCPGVSCSVLEPSRQRLCLYPPRLPSLHSAASQRSANILKLAPSRWKKKLPLHQNVQCSPTGANGEIRQLFCIYRARRSSKVRTLSHVLFPELLSRSGMTYSSLSPDFHHVG